MYGTVETFARDILKTEFLLQDARHGRKCDIVMVDEVDSMLIDQGVQCTYLSHDIDSLGMRHFEPILALIWMNLGMFFPIRDEHQNILYYATQPEVFFVTMTHLNSEVDPFQISRLAEENEQFPKGFTDSYLCKDIEGQKEMLRSLIYHDLNNLFLFASDYLDLHIDVNPYFFKNGVGLMFESTLTRLSILVWKAEFDEERIFDFYYDGDDDYADYFATDDDYPDDNHGGLSSVVLPVDLLKDRLAKMISGVVSNDNGINLPVHLRKYCLSQMRNWIDSAFLAQQMRSDREYVVRDNGVYPVDYKSTGVIETNKKWGDSLQQFLEMKHGLPLSPLSLITNFLSNVDFFDRYGNQDVYNILGVSGTLGSDDEKKFMSDTFSVDFVTIPTSKRRKLFELDGRILRFSNPYYILSNLTKIQYPFSTDKSIFDVSVQFKIISNEILLTIARQRAALVICEDIATAENIHKRMSKENIKASIYLHTEGVGYDGGRMSTVLKPGDVVITTNLGARGTDFVTDDVVNKNGGLFVLVTFIPLNDRVEEQAFGRTGRRGATGSCQIIVNNHQMPMQLRQCDTVEEAKRLRDSIEKHRLDSMNDLEVNKMRRKQELFQEYCKLKKEFVSSSKCDQDDLKVQVELLDESWAKWIKNCETTDTDLKRSNSMEELRKLIGDCSKQAKLFESENIYHLLKFGAVRLMKDDFKGATGIYNQVITMDPTWSAFAHYYRAYCTLQMKDDGYIRRAIDDLNSSLCEVQNYKQKCLFTEIHVLRTDINVDNFDAIC